MRPARVRVVGRFQFASKPTEATVTIDRELRLFSVRPLRSRREYTLPLATMAEIAFQRVVRAETVDKRRQKGRAK